MGGVSWFPRLVAVGFNWFIYLNTWLPAGSTVWGGNGTLNTEPC